MSARPISSSGSDLVPGEDAAAPDPGPPFAGLLDVGCPISVVLGTGTISVRRCVALSRDSVLRLAQPAGEDLQVFVGGVLVARGEVVIVDDSTAVRLTEIARSSGAEVCP
jgi:flagellar motor switch protein FliN/FliY